jgi:crotonobetainyl-CoA:carnitine CoA-transferase CaiB-like acyl-CoA transferase
VAPDAARGPCAGFRVLDFSTVVSGPLCTQILGDLGADVIKVETPRSDVSRFMGPPFRDRSLSGFLVQFNRNKRSVVLDLKQPDAAVIARRLAVGDALHRAPGSLRGDPGLATASPSPAGPAHG